MPTDKLLLIGAGGHAKVVYDALRCGSESLDVEVRDDDFTLNGRIFFDCKIIAPIGDLAELPMRVHIAIGNNRARGLLGQALQDIGKSCYTVIHPKATLSPYARIGAGVFVAAGAIVGPAAEIGAGVIINHGAIIDHDCQVGAWSHVAPNATLGGGVCIGEGGFIGAGAVILPGLSVGDWAVVGAGAVVTKNVQAGETVVGVPARVIRKNEEF